MMKALRFFAVVVTVLAAGIWAQRPVTGQQSADLTFVDGEVLIKFRPTTIESRRNATRQSLGATKVRRFEHVGVEHVHLPKGLSVASAIQRLQLDSEVLAAAPNYIRRMVAAPPPNDPYWLNDSLWGLLKISSPAAWSNFGAGNGSVVVGIIDTGINYQHPDLIANVWTNPGEIPGNGIDDDGNGYIDDIHGIDTRNGDSNPLDDNGHGTHVAGTIGGVGNNGIGVAGVNWNVKLLACKFLSSTGSGSDAGAIECLNYFVALKQRGINIRVTNNSWGGGGANSFLKDAFDAAGNAGIVNICAAGNDNSNNDATPFYPAGFASPSIIAVAASDINDARANFSNYGATTVDLAAPGVGIWSTYGGGYASLAGTSMASPHVAGAAALIASVHPQYSPSDIKTVLLDNVDKLPQWNGVVASGGRLNLFASLLASPSLPAPITLLTTQTPALQNISDGVSYELGVRVMSDVAGQITALRFWKGTAESGTHTGHVWTAAGQLLATVTFSNESASGWQQQALATPVAMAANTEYVVSVTTPPNKLFVDTQNVFTTPLVNGHLRGLAGANGVFGPIGSFPTQSYQSSNYFRDLVFQPLGGGDTTPPTVTITQPTGGSNVSGLVTIAATANDNVGVAGVQFQVDGANIGNEVQTPPYSITWDSTAVANGSRVLTAIARDAAGNTTPTSVTVTVANAASQTLLTTQTPVTQNLSDGVAYELGVRVVSDIAGQITALRFWKGTGENGPHTGHVWTGAGQLLATVTFGNESASGWQQQALATPVAMAANTEYVVSVTTPPNMLFVDTQDVFTTPLVNGHLRALAGANGVFGPSGTFPTQAYRSSNYFRDLLFVPSVGGDTTPPTVTITQPTGGSNVSGLVTIAATANDNVGVAGVQFQVDGANIGNEVQTPPYSITWDSTAVANGSRVLTAIARDAAGNTTPTSVTVTVSNVSQTLLTTQTPVLQNISDGVTYELGVRVISDVPGQITALRFWKGTGESGTHTGHVWTGAGQLLATVTFGSESASGWQQQALAAPVAIAANTEYVVSVTTPPNTLFVDTQNVFTTPLVNGHLRALAGANGVFGPSGTFPTQAYQSSNYFRDLVFVPQ